MKIVKLMGTALIAVLVCVNFASCSEDDGGGNGDGKKRIKKVVQTDGTDERECEYTYNEGKLIAATETWNDDICNYQFHWTDDKITVSVDNEEEPYKITHILEGGLVQSTEVSLNPSYTTTMTYDNDRVAKVDLGRGYSTSVYWNNDKLHSTKSYDRDLTLTYGTTCLKGYFPRIGDLINGTRNGILYNAHPELIGAYSTALPTKMKSSSNRYDEANYTADISYKFDNEGYISEIITRTNKGEITTMKFTWE